MISLRLIRINVYTKRTLETEKEDDKKVFKNYFQLNKIKDHKLTENMKTSCKYMQ